jgi:hypothetical protein
MPLQSQNTQERRPLTLFSLPLSAEDLLLSNEVDSSELYAHSHKYTLILCTLSFHLMQPTIDEDIATVNFRALQSFKH